MKKLTRETLRDRLFLGLILLFGLNTTFAQVTITQNSDLNNIGCQASEPNNDYQACIKIGNYLYTGHWGGNLGIGIYNLSNPSYPTYIATNELDNSTSSSVYSMKEANGYLFITARYSEKLYVINYLNPTNLQVVGVINSGVLHGQITIEGNNLFLANEDTKTFEVFNIANPANPFRVSSINIGTGWSWSTAYKSGIAYCSTSGSNTENAGIKVINVSNLNAPNIISTIDILDFQPYRITVIGDYLYAACESNTNTLPPKFIIYNISNPSSPTMVSEIVVPNVSSLRSLSVEGNYLYVGCQSIGTTGAISIYNIVNAASPVLVAQSSSNVSRGFFSLAHANGFVYCADKIRHEICTYSITSPCPTPTATISSQSNVSCNGASNGTVSVASTGGSSFTYSWTPTGGSSATASGLSAGTYTCTITNDCGNTTTQSVTISQPVIIASSQTLSICENESVTVGINTYSTTGVYTDILTTGNGCDSTVTTNLTVYPTFVTAETIMIEAGQSAIIGGISRSESGDYVTNLSSVHGCDSIVTTTLNVVNMFAPSNLVATAVSQNQINLTWSDNTNNEVGYMIERANSIGGTFTQIGWVDQNETTISDLELETNTSYCYRVVGIESNGSYSSYSTIACSSTFGSVAIAASDLTATPVSQTGINLTWSDNSSDETGFIILSEINGAGFNIIDTVGANVTTYNNSGLIANTYYNYRVIAFNQAGNSINSNVASALTFDELPLAATNLVATAESAIDVRLNWSDVATNETAYIIQRSTTSGTGYVTIATIPANTTTYGDYDNVVPNTTYFYQVLASNTGGNVSSNEATILTLSTCGYVLTNMEMNCRDASICMPVISNHTITGAIGFDFTVNYDTLNYDFESVSINSAMINPSYAEYSTYTNPDGSIKVLINLNASAPLTASFNGTGSLLCMNFTKHLDHEQGVDVINISPILESFENDAILHCADNGFITVTKDTLAAGTLRSWNNNAALSYNSNTPTQYLITKIYGSNNTGSAQSTNFVTPNMSGQYNHNIYDGQYVKIIRDIAPTTVMMPFVNGTDVTLVKQIALGNNSFLPNAYQMIASDVNMDGQVTAGDVTLIKKRVTNSIPEFPQMWNASNGEPSRDWLFVDSITVATQPSFQRSSTYPAYDGIGFNKNHVPIVGLSLPVAVVYSGNCPEFTPSSYRGILLGDVNGNFNQASAGGTKSLEINSIAFELDEAVQQANCIVDIPFYSGSQIGDSVMSIDFDIEFDSTNLEFLEITYVTSSETSEQLYNQIATNRVLFTSSDLAPFTSSTLLGYIRFKTNNNQVIPTDLGVIKSYINGEEKSVSVDGIVNCSSQSGVYKNSDNHIVNIYPNPNKGIFNVDLLSIPGEVIVTIVDFSGKTIKTITTNGSQVAKVDISELSKGVYMLNVNTVYSSKTYRIVKQ